MNKICVLSLFFLNDTSYHEWHRNILKYILKYDSTVVLHAHIPCTNILTRVH